MLSKFMCFLESIHCARSLISVIVFIIGIVLIMIWKFKRKSVSVLICSIVLMVVPCIVIIHGCYSAYVRPSSMEVEFTQQELADFSEYLLENDRFLDVKTFLRNNEKSYYKAENGKERELDGEILYYDTIEQGVIYQPNSEIYYYLFSYEDEETAERIFKHDYVPDVNNELSMENKVYSENDDYSVYARQNFESTFFNLHQGEHNATELTIVILHENYIIWITEVTEKHTPKLYSLIKEEKLFDSDYKLRTWVKV